MIETTIASKSSIFILEGYYVGMESFLGSAVLQITMLAVVFSYIRSDAKKKNFNFFNLGFLIFFLGLILAGNDKNIGKLEALSCLNSDYLSFLSKNIILFITTVAFFYKSYETKSSLANSFEYFVFISGGALGSILLCSTADFLTTYLAIELQSISFYFMSCSKTNSNHSIEGALKYFVVGSMSSAIFLLGSSLIYWYSGTIEFSSLRSVLLAYTDNNEMVYAKYDLITEWFIPCFGVFAAVLDNPFFAELLDNSHKFLLKFEVVNFGLMLVYTALLVKIAAAPFHYWSLDVYESSPNTSVLFFSTAPKIGLFVVLLRVFYLTTFSVSTTNGCLVYFMIFSFLSILLGSLGGLCQRKIKTLVAYSSTSHTGYSLLCLSSGTSEGLTFMFYYLFVYTISTLSFWLAYMLLKKQLLNQSFKNNKELGDLVSLKSSNPTLAMVISASVFSLSGVPPFIGFLVKFSLFFSLTQISTYFLAVFSILIGVISTFYYLRVVKVMYFEGKKIKKLYYPNNLTKSSIAVIVFLFLITLFVKPNFFLLISHKSLLLLLPCSF